MPGVRMIVHKGRASLLAGLCLAIFILLLACLDHQSSTLDPSLRSGDPNIQTSAHTIPRGLSPETVNTDSPVQSLNRRSDEDGSDFDLSDLGPALSDHGSAISGASSLDSVDSETWKTQKNDGPEVSTPEMIEQAFQKALQVGQNIEERWNKGSTSASERLTLWKYKQIEEYGWTREEFNSKMSGPPQNSMLALHSLPGSSENGGVVVRFEHTESTTVNGKHYPATEAHFEIHFRLGQRAIILLDAVGPAYTEPGKLLPKEQLVPLRHASDFMFLEWQNLCEKKKVNPASLKYILHDNTYNVQSRNVVRKAVGGQHLMENLKQWPGVYYKPNDANDALGRFKAMIGTPNGVATTNMFFQHPEILGANRRVAEVVVWRVKPLTKGDFRRDGPYVGMMFKFSDARAQGTIGTPAPGSSKGAASSGSTGPKSEQPGSSKGAAASDSIGPESGQPGSSKGAASSDWIEVKSGKPRRKKGAAASGSAGLESGQPGSSKQAASSGSTGPGPKSGQGRRKKGAASSGPTGPKTGQQAPNKK